MHADKCVLAYVRKPRDLTKTLLGSNLKIVL